MNHQKGFLSVVIGIIVALLVAGGVFFVVKKQQSNVSSVKEEKQNVAVQPSVLVNAPVLTQCGSIEKKIFSQYDYQPTSAEMNLIKSSLTCINQAIVKCSPAILNLTNGSDIRSVRVDGQGSIGCNVSIVIPNGSSMCPLPPDYVKKVQEKFNVSNYDASIISNLTADIGSELQLKNKNCIVSTQNQSPIANAKQFLESMQKDLGINYEIKSYVGFRNMSGFRINLPVTFFDRASAYIKAKFGGGNSPANLTTELGNGYENAKIVCMSTGLRAGSTSADLPYVWCADK